MGCRAAPTRAPRAAGYIGALVLELLLRTCPEIRKASLPARQGCCRVEQPRPLCASGCERPQIYCVVRAKKGMTAANRLKDIFKGPTFRLLQPSLPQLRDKAGPPTCAAPRQRCSAGGGAELRQARAGRAGHRGPCRAQLRAVWARPDEADQARPARPPAADGSSALAPPGRLPRRETNYIVHSAASILFDMPIQVASRAARTPPTRWQALTFSRSGHPEEQLCAHRGAAAPGGGHAAAALLHLRVHRRAAAARLARPGSAPGGASEPGALTLAVGAAFVNANLPKGTCIQEQLYPLYGAWRALGEGGALPCT